MKTKMMGAAAAVLLVAAPATAQIDIHGFVEAGTGVRIADAPSLPAEWSGAPAGSVWSENRDFTLREARVQLKSDIYGDVGEAHFVVDLLDNQVGADDSSIQLREGYGKFNAFADRLELRIGRQPTTWGTGDLLFINDLFPKDWVSFFVGREDQYLKSPSDAIRLGLFNVLPFQVDVVYTPQFTADVLPDGRHLAFWSPALAPAMLPEESVENGELAVRLNRYLGSWNWALYGYRGFWKQPLGGAMAPAGLVHFYHPELNVYGASTRGPLFGGVAWVETGYYDSRDDTDGTNVLVPNSEWRAMAGFERQWWSDFTGGLQFYWEGMVDYDDAEAARQQFVDGAVSMGADRDATEHMLYLKDENRTLVTLRLRQQFLYQTLTAGVFTYYSPSDEDAYVRFSLDYDYSDQLKLTVGGNVFDGDDDRTMFGMNDANDNLFGRVRYSF